LAPGGRTAISASNDGTWRVWAGAPGECLRAVLWRKGRFLAVALTDDRTLTVTGDSENAVRVWSVASGECLRVFEGHTQSVNAVALSPDGRFVISGSGDALDRMTPEQLHCEERVVRDDMLRVWDLASGKCLRVLEGHEDDVQQAVLTPDGRLLLSTSHDGTLRVWDLVAGKCCRVIHGLTDGTNPVAVTPDGRTAISTGAGRTVCFWDIATGECLREVPRTDRYLTEITLTPDGSHAVFASWDRGVLRLLALASGECWPIYHAGAPVCSLSRVTPDGRLLCGTTDGAVHSLLLQNVPQGPPFVTAVYRWRPAVQGTLLAPDQPMPGGHTDVSTAACPWCGHFIEPDATVLDAIAGISRAVDLLPEQSQCLALPAEAWDELRLRSACPQCGCRVRFSPFVVDNRSL
jgi:WD40 repeat protein